MGIPVDLQPGACRPQRCSGHQMAMAWRRSQAPVRICWLQPGCRRRPTPMQQPWQGHQQGCQALCMVHKLPCLCMIPGKSSAWEPRKLVLIFDPLQCPICLRGVCWQTSNSEMHPLQTLRRRAVRACSFWTNSGRCCPSACCPGRSDAATARAGTCRPGTGHERQDG